jgi:hypothetical protein
MNRMATASLQTRGSMLMNSRWPLNKGGRGGGGGGEGRTAEVPNAECDFCVADGDGFFHKVHAWVALEAMVKEGGGGGACDEDEKG